MKLKDLFIEQFRGWRASEVAWLAFSVSCIIALSLHWGDTAPGMTAAVTGMMYTVLAGKGKPACFIFGLVNTPLYAYIAFKAGYYGDFALNAYYFAMMLPGLAAWLRHRSGESEEGIKRTSLSAKGRLCLAGACAAGILALWGALHLLNGTRPFCDSVTNVLSIAAMLLTVRRAIEEWVLWIVVNTVEVFMWWRAWCAGEGSISVLLMWILFLVNGIYLLSLWMRVEARHRICRS
jgi:nicotinamide mononucleotide transporter